MITSLMTPTGLPLLIKPEDPSVQPEDFQKILHEKREFLKHSLLKHGGLLFRGFPIKNEDDFISLIQGLQLGHFINYIGGDSPRNKVREGVYTSTEAPPSVKIPLHNELSFVKYYPRHIYFYCHTPPAKDGETIIADARRIYNAIDSDVKKRFTEKGLHYLSCYYNKSRLMEFVNSLQKGHRRWVDVFETEDRQQVERVCQEHEFEFQWHQNDWLEIGQRRPASLKHPETGEMVWFNQAHLFDFNPRLLGWWRYLGTKVLYYRKHMKLHQVFFGDGTTIARSDLYHILDVLDANTIAFPWQKGDVLVLDNILAMHGRATFTGKRRILTAMTG